MTGGNITQWMMTAGGRFPLYASCALSQPILHVVRHSRPVKPVTQPGQCAIPPQNDRQTTKRDKPETVIPWPVVAQAAVTATVVNFFSSISLHLRPPTSYYGDATTIVFPGIVPSLLSRGGGNISLYPFQH